MSLRMFRKLPVPALELEYPLHYADSAVSAAKVRESSVSGELKRNLQHHMLDLKLHPHYLDHVNIYDCVAKCYNLGVSKHPTLTKNRQWFLASVLLMMLMEFDEHFDKPQSLTPEYIAKLSKEIRGVLRSLSRHNLTGLQGGLEDWPAEVPGKEAYVWLLKEADNLRKGGAQLIHDTFVDYVFGVEEEVIEWKSDLCRGDLTAWNLDRYIEIRKRSVAIIVSFVGPLFITHEWLQKEHIIACTDLIYEASIIVALGNDILGMKRDHGGDGAADMTAVKIAASSEVAQCHNEMVEVLHKKVLELEGDTRRYMEEVEASVVGIFLWQCHSKRYSL